MSHRTASRPAVLALCATALLLTTPHLLTAQTYFPGRHPDWERRTPEQLGLDAAAIQRAVDIAIAGESQSPRDLAFNHLRSFGREPLGDAVGPFTIRAPQTGVIVYKGYIVAEWGEPAKADNTFSVSKSFLSTSVGLAYDHGLIGDVDDLVRDYMPAIVLDTGDGEPGDENGRRPKLLFDSEHNRKITWDHLLRQTSDWEGTLWGKPEWADRPEDPSTWRTRPRNEPGTVGANRLRPVSRHRGLGTVTDVLRRTVIPGAGCSLVGPGCGRHEARAPLRGVNKETDWPGQRTASGSRRATRS